MEINLTKTMTGFVPTDQRTKEWAEKVKIGTCVHGDFKKVRNSAFHRKFFALLNLSFEYWEPGEIDFKYGTPEKNFEQFRDDVTILAGYYTTVIRLDGSVRVVPKSISFANMDDTEFEGLYNNVLNVILKRINVLKDMTAEEVNNIVNQVMGFA